MTPACHAYRELIGGYVLDGLEPEERELVRRHMETCEPCAREHAELASIPVLLDLAGSADALPERPPARLEEAVLDQFARERRGVAGTTAGIAEEPPAPASAAPAAAPRRARRSLPRFPRMPRIAVAGALACAVAVLLAATLIDSGGGDRSPGYRARLASALVPGATGDARLYVHPAGTTVRLRISGLKPPPGKAYNYELWCVRGDGWRVSAGTFRVDSNGNADVRLTTAAKPTEYDTLSVEAQPAGATSTTAGRRVMVGKISS
jgi:anti-sigma-K factor RskA